MKQFDIIVIGAGHNGLTTAALLAKKGKKVIVLEKRKISGGIAVGEEFHPGYKTVGLLHDASQVRKNVIEELQLVKHGLTYTEKRPDVTILSNDGMGITLSSNKAKTSNDILNISQSDVGSYHEYTEFIAKISGFVYNHILNTGPPEIELQGPSQLLDLIKKGLALKRLGKKTMMEFLRAAPMCVADFLNERFNIGFLKAGMALPALSGNWTGPWSAGNTLNLLFYEASSRLNIKGGPAALVAAIEKSAIANGVEIRTETNVDRIIIRNGTVKGVMIQGGEEIYAKVVAASCTPARTFLEMIGSNNIEHKLTHGIKCLRSRGITAKINLALTGHPEFKYSTNKPIEFARTGNSIDEMEKAFDCVKYRNFSEKPFLDIHIPTVSNPELAPVGNNVVSVLVHFAPYRLEAGWSEEQKDKLYEHTISAMEKQAPGIRGMVVGKEVLSPVDIEERYGLTGGNIFHGEHAIDQMIIRPVPSCMFYRTPLHGLFLCGSGSHPGGGITCAPGALAAGAVIKEGL